MRSSNSLGNSIANLPSDLPENTRDNIIAYLAKVKVGSSLTREILQQNGVYCSPNNFNKLCEYLLNKGVIKEIDGEVFNEATYLFDKSFETKQDKEKDKIYYDFLATENSAKFLIKKLNDDKTLSVFLSDVIGSSEMVSDPPLKIVFDDCYNQLNYIISLILSRRDVVRGLNFGGAKGDDSQVLLSNEKDMSYFINKLIEEFGSYLNERQKVDLNYSRFKLRMIVATISGKGIVRKDVHGHWVLGNCDQIIALARILGKKEGHLKNVNSTKAFAVMFGEDKILNLNKNKLEPEGEKNKYPEISGAFFHANYDGKISPIK